MSNRLWTAVSVAGVAAIAAASVSDSSGLAQFFTVGAFGLMAAMTLEFLLDPPELKEKAKPREPVSRGGFSQSMLDRMPAPFILVDLRGRVTYANGEAARALPRIQPGAHFSTMMRAPDFIAAIDDVVRTGREQHVHFVLASRAQQHVVAHMALLPAGGEFGPDEQIMIQIEDQTEQRRADTLRSDFIANASHELRTPLASIIGYIETLRGHAKDDPEARNHFLGIMDKQAARMRRLVDDLMSLSRIELSEHVRPNALVDLNGLVREAASGLEPQREQYGASLQITLPQAPLMVRGDRDQLLQVLVNLIDNGMKYGGEGDGVHITAAPNDQSYPGMAGITVADSGPGIAREHIPRLTERFYRVSAKQSMEKGGTGLGLAIVKHIVNRHMGELAIESVLGRGSRFTLWFPAAKSDQKHASHDEIKAKTIA